MQIMPLMVGFFAWNFAAGPVIYWITQNVFSGVQQYFITGFGSMRDLPGMKWLPVPPWATPPTPTSSSASKVIVTQSKPGAAATDGGQSTAPGGLMGRLYQQINKRVEQVEQQRSGGQSSAGGDAGSTTNTPGSRPSVISSDNPARRSSRRARSKQ
jgi:YidC/Oxa1 family membrane protein insertase